MNRTKTELEFRVLGNPMAKPAWNRSRSSSKARRRASPWFKRVRAAALAEVLDGPFPVFTVGQPLVLEVTYWLERPASHYRTGKFAGELKRAAPAFPTSKPDLTNLTKGLEDVLADWPHGSFALVYQGDQQIVDHVTRKRWATSDDRPGARVLVREVFEEPC